MKASSICCFILINLFSSEGGATVFTNIPQPTTAQAFVGYTSTAPQGPPPLQAQPAVTVLHDQDTPATLIQVQHPPPPQLQPQQGLTAVTHTAQQQVTASGGVVASGMQMKHEVNVVPGGGMQSGATGVSLNGLQAAIGSTPVTNLHIETQPQRRSTPEAGVPTEFTHPYCVAIQTDICSEFREYVLANQGNKRSMKNTVQEIKYLCSQREAYMRVPHGGLRSCGCDVLQSLHVSVPRRDDEGGYKLDEGYFQPMVIEGKVGLYESADNPYYGDEQADRPSHSLHASFLQRGKKKKHADPNDPNNVATYVLMNDLSEESKPFDWEALWAVEAEEEAEEERRKEEAKKEGLPQDVEEAEEEQQEVVDEESNHDDEPPAGPLKPPPALPPPVPRPVPRQPSRPVPRQPSRPVPRVPSRPAPPFVPPTEDEVVEPSTNPLEAPSKQTSRFRPEVVPPAPEITPSLKYDTLPQRQPTPSESSYEESYEEPESYYDEQPQFFQSSIRHVIKQTIHSMAANGRTVVYDAAPDREQKEIAALVFKAEPAVAKTMVDLKRFRDHIFDGLTSLSIGNVAVSIKPAKRLPQEFIFEIRVTHHPASMYDSEMKAMVHNILREFAAHAAGKHENAPKPIEAENPYQGIDLTLSLGPSGSLVCSSFASGRLVRVMAMMDAMDTNPVEDLRSPKEVKDISVHFIQRLIGSLVKSFESSGFQVDVGEGSMDQPGKATIPSEKWEEIYFGRPSHAEMMLIDYCGGPGAVGWKSGGMQDVDYRPIHAGGMAPEPWMLSDRSMKEVSPHKGSSVIIQHTSPSGVAGAFHSTTISLQHPWPSSRGYYPPRDFSAASTEASSDLGSVRKSYTRPPLYRPPPPPARQRPHPRPRHRPRRRRQPPPPQASRADLANAVKPTDAGPPPPAPLTPEYDPEEALRLRQLSKDRKQEKAREMKNEEERRRRDALEAKLDREVPQDLYNDPLLTLMQRIFVTVYEEKEEFDLAEELRLKAGFTDENEVAVIASFLNGRNDDSMVHPEAYRSLFSAMQLLMLPQAFGTVDNSPDTGNLPILSSYYLMFSTVDAQREGTDVESNFEKYIEELSLAWPDSAALKDIAGEMTRDFSRTSNRFSSIEVQNIERVSSDPEGVSASQKLVADVMSLGLWFSVLDRDGNGLLDTRELLAMGLGMDRDLAIQLQNSIINNGHPDPQWASGHQGLPISFPDWMTLRVLIDVSSPCPYDTPGYQERSPGGPETEMTQSGKDGYYRWTLDSKSETVFYCGRPAWLPDQQMPDGSSSSLLARVLNVRKVADEAIQTAQAQAGINPDGYQSLLSSILKRLVSMDPWAFVSIDTDGSGSLHFDEVEAKLLGDTTRTAHVFCIVATDKSRCPFQEASMSHEVVESIKQTKIYQDGWHVFLMARAVAMDPRLKKALSAIMAKLAADMQSSRSSDLHPVSEAGVQARLVLSSAMKSLGEFKWAEVPPPRQAEKKPAAPSPSKKVKPVKPASVAPPPPAPAPEDEEEEEDSLQAFLRNFPLALDDGNGVPEDGKITNLMKELAEDSEATEEEKKEKKKRRRRKKKKDK